MSVASRFVTSRQANGLLAVRAMERESPWLAACLQLKLF